MTLVVLAVALGFAGLVAAVAPRADAWRVLLTFTVGTNASPVLAARFGVPNSLLPLSLLIVAVAAGRIVRSRPWLDDFPPSRLPGAAAAALVAVFVSAAIGPFVSVAPASSSASVMLLIEHLLLLAAVVVAAGSRRGMRSAMVGLVAAGAAVSAITNLQFVLGLRSSNLFGFGWWNAETIGGRGAAVRAAGPFTNDPNAYAQYLVTMIGLALGLLVTSMVTGGARRWWWAAVASMVLAVVHTASRGGMIALLAVVMLAALVHRLEGKHVAIAALALVVVVVGPFGVGPRLLTLVDATSATSAGSAADRGLRGRASEMLAAVHMFTDHPLAGVGYGTYNDRYLDYSRGLGLDPRFEQRSAHSLPLEIAAEQGLIGLITWTVLTAVAIVVVLRLRRARDGLGDALGLALVGFGTAALFLHDVYPRLLWTLIGLVIAGAWLAGRLPPACAAQPHSAPAHTVPVPSAPAPDRPLRVAMVIQSYVPAVGGAERQLAALMPLLAERGVEPIVVSRAMPGRPTRDDIDGFPVVRVPLHGPKPLRSLGFVIGARRELRRFDPDVVHAYDTLTPSTIATGHRRRTGTPVVTKLLRSGDLGDLHRLERKPMGRRRLTRLLAEVDVFVTIASELDRELDERGIGEDRRVRIPNGVDVERFHPRDDVDDDDRLAAQLAAAREGTGRLTVIATGRLAPEKRLAELAERWSRVVETVPGARLLIVGEGPDAERISAADTTGLVELLGARDDVAELLRDADVYVSASAAEGLSNSLLEALASGLACVVTDVGGVRDVIVDDVHGAVVDADDLDELVDELVELLRDAQRRRELGSNARRRVEAGFGLPATADRLVALYADLAARRSAHASLVDDAADPDRGRHHDHVTADDDHEDAPV